MTMKFVPPLALVALLASPALAEEDADETETIEESQSQQDGIVADGPPPGIGETVFDGDYLSIGIGAGYGPSYSGSDDYVFFPLPIVQASYGGIDINPRPAGLAIDFIPDADEGPSFDLGIAGRLRSDRADQIEDPVVESLGELDRAVEVGPTAGVSFPGVLNRFDSLSFNVDALWDIAGAHSGMTVAPSVTYFTPLSRGIAGSLSFSATFVDDDFADYYYSVSPAQSVASGLPAFQADGGLNSLGANLLLAFDLNGDVTDGGFSIVTIAGYSRLVGDAKDTPFTSIRGDADQFLVGAGIGYTF
ncbi:MipA/OmpV family protein [Erythrobacter litoralis]|uniref:MltA-interacting MipA n=1 Tax=Erythrobacter litoralis (strain HTCC2594) TaxID=314225 RepID=Q2N8C4_ERYLH|nr:MipA/OmpV family protein [Erythrobacter litoralis]ABC64067.1 MltA-interacting MipA [Erythrobacter litoralis HTCC2594]